MTVYGFPQGNPIAALKACNGTPAVINLTTIAGGASQNGYVATTDYQIVITADGTNKSVTLPDPNKYGGTPGDTWAIWNGQSGQTLLVFPPTGGNIDGAGANTSVNLSQGATLTCCLVSFTATTSVWIGDGGS